MRCFVSFVRRSYSRCVSLEKSTKSFQNPRRLAGPLSRNVEGSVIEGSVILCTMGEIKEIKPIARAAAKRRRNIGTYSTTNSFSITSVHPLAVSDHQRVYQKNRLLREWRQPYFPHWPVLYSLWMRHAAQYRHRMFHSEYAAKQNHCR